MKAPKILFTTLIAAASILTSCSKDPEPYKAPEASTRTAVAENPQGLKNSSNIHAQSASAWINVLNGLTTNNARFTIPTDAEVEHSKNSSVFYWKEFTISYWMSFSVKKDQITWTLEYETLTIPRTLLLTATENTKATNGQWTIYNPLISTQVLWNYQWSLNSGNYAATVTFAGQPGYDLLRFEVQSNANKSGYVRLFHAEQKLTDVIWNADGSGSWWIYDIIAGSYSGNWN